ncbi:MerR family transcriptional regulator [Candidatus Mycobacterium wuenschmannii]|uniref:MerR family transcriptional regulator n=1 Tax=Candidatus Mycobacterium wuenschmannii TaxID=3027808 RepID=A0ABY8VU52_9MYCO|nr:MerR family transcriptional regulator [Candidatus Mycobacterium wuenschmannii]WIM87032.1 MerR family transcriptional regulator [Candidatus Mycobacterium wuenschmannii]
MSSEGPWTLDELVGRAAAALAGPAYPGSPNGRVRDVPDRRTVRWYSTIGLVDRPTAMRGRTALYSSRHLLQIVAVKRLQAQGRSLADIQAELAGATSKALRRVADIPADVTTAEAAVPKPAARARFWADRPAAAPAAIDAAADTVTVRTVVRLPGGAELILPGRPGDDDLAAIHAAARPLLDVLAERGLLEREEWSPS